VSAVNPRNLGGRMREPTPNVPASGDQPRGTPIHISDLGISMGVLSIMLVPAPGYRER